MKKSQKNRAGFTLLEVVLAVSVFALVMSALYATWNAGLRAWKRASESAEDLQRQRIIVDAMAELLRGAIFSMSKPAIYQFRGNIESPETPLLSFVTSSDLLLPPSQIAIAGMRRVTFTMETDESGQPFLALTTENALAPRETAENWATTRIFSSDVSNFFVRFLDPQSGQWIEQWTDENRAPSAVQLSVYFRPRRDVAAQEVVVTSIVPLAGTLPNVQPAQTRRRTTESDATVPAPES
jgi:prepilin-type N-terminal cleavage/methylation domain-containing protein